MAQIGMFDCANRQVMTCSLQKVHPASHVPQFLPQPQLSMTVLFTSDTHNFAGPSDTNPLTPDELSILLALPRAARTSPDSLFVRLPKGAVPSEGYLDVSCSQACAIVARLAAAWRARTSVPLGPGTTVCLMISPYLHGIFHHLALWALGCTVQYVTMLFGDEIVDTNLEQSGCKVVIYSGKTNEWVDERKKRHAGIEMVELTEDEYAGGLAQKELDGLDPAPAWPTPKRPCPASVIQSSSSTSKSKLMSFSLHYYTLGLAYNCCQHLAAQPYSPAAFPKRPQTHPRLIYTPPFWQTFHRFLLDHLVTATPFTLVPGPDMSCLSGHELAEWIKTLDVGGMVSAAFNVRDILLIDTYTELLQGLYAVTMIGSVVDEQLSDLITRKRIKATNTLGISELGRVMTANRPPYTYLRPFPDFPPPLAVPISDSSHQYHQTTSPVERPPGREVELWQLVSRCPQLAHIALRGGVPLKLEPFPGAGPYRGELGMNLGDVFYEMRTREGDEEDLVYAHVGRMDDYVRLSNDDSDINSSRYEIEVRALIESQLVAHGNRRWRFDAAQLFGTNLPKTALVVQLLGGEDGGVEQDVVEIIRTSVEMANDQLQLEGPLRVDPVKRMLVVTHVGRM
ncbi:hypothetical protein FRC09_020885 [Ceratobasidium sp. 395]|nr:hypothetical protein FRC09_020885 [Ceratobasidium sp. 395]